MVPVGGGGGEVCMYGVYIFLGFMQPLIKIIIAPIFEKRVSTVWWERWYHAFPIEIKLYIVEARGQNEDYSSRVIDNLHVSWVQTSYNLVHFMLLLT